MEIDFSTFISACAGGIAGALAAVYFQSEKEKHDTKTKNKAALMATKFSLQIKSDTLEGLYNQFLKKTEDLEYREIQIPYIVNSLGPSRLDIEPLIFLTEDHDRVLFEIQALYECFNVATEAIRIRNEHILEIYNAEPPSDLEGLAEGHIRRDLKIDKHILLKHQTDAVFESLHRVLDETPKTVSKIDEIYERIF